MIVLRDFRLEDHGREVEAVCDIVSEHLPAHLRFRTDRETAHYLDIDQPNWAAVALFYPAMMFGEDLVIEGDLSPRLLYNLRNDLMSLFRSYEPSLKPIAIEAGMAAAVPSDFPDPRGVATGFSGGVDSFCTTMLYDNPGTPPELRLDTLAVFSVGAFGITGSEMAGRLQERGRETAAEYAGLKGYATVYLDSNMDDIFAPLAALGPADFVKTVGLRNCSAALLLQKGLKAYLPSSSVYWIDVSCTASHYTGYFEPVSLPLLSTERLHLQSAGAGLSRKDKQMLIADNPDVWTRLDVCVNHTRLESTEFRNCGRCWKCLQTSLIYETEGVLDRFSTVFDLNYRKANHAMLMQEIADVTVTRGVGRQSVRDARAAGIHVPRPRSRFRRWLAEDGPGLRGAGNKLLAVGRTGLTWLRTNPRVKAVRRPLIRLRKALFRRLGFR